MKTGTKCSSASSELLRIIIARAEQYWLACFNLFYLGEKTFHFGLNWSLITLMGQPLIVTVVQSW